MKNGVRLFDTDGNEIHAHGGHMLRVGDTRYWYGENRRGNNYVSCYSSTDMEHWTFRRNVLRVDSPTEDVGISGDLRLYSDAPSSDGHDSLENDSIFNPHKVNIERPKVLYCEKTKKYVMWAHYENGRDYHCAGCIVATCDTPDGDFVYHGWFNPLGHMSRDCTLFKDTDGRAYFISAARDNKDTNMYRLSDDYLRPEELSAVLWPGALREAQSVAKRGDVYYMFSSYCTGWAPNQGMYASAPSITGPWSELKNIGDETTFRSQPAFILPPEITDKNEFIYFGDRWDAKDYFNSTYIALKLDFGSDGVTMDYVDETEL